MAANTSLNRSLISSQYQASLGRTPSAAEIDAWLGTGQSIESIAQGIRTSPEAASLGYRAITAADAAALALAPAAAPAAAAPAAAAPAATNALVAEPAAATAAPAAAAYYTESDSRFAPRMEFMGDGEVLVTPSVPHERVWQELARQQGISPVVIAGTGDMQEYALNPQYEAWKASQKAQGIDVGMQDIPGTKYSKKAVILQNGSPVGEPFTVKTGSTFVEGLMELAPIALAAIGGQFLGAGGTASAAAQQAALTAGNIGAATTAALPAAAGAGAAGVGAAGAGAAGAGAGAGAGGAGFVGLESELAGLAAAEAGMAVPGAALPGIETALAGGAAGVSAYESAAAAKAAADIAARTAVTPPPGTTPPGTTPPGTTPPGTTPPGGTTVPNVPAGTIPWGEIIATLGSLYGGSQAAEAARDAARIQAEAMDRALALQTRMYEEGVQRQAPFLQGGTEAFNRLTALSTGGPAAAQNFLTMDPGYGFRLGEGMKALDRMQASRGNLLSGGAIKAGQRYAQDVASQEYGSAYNRLAQLADVGPRAAGVTSQLGQNYATSAGNLMSQQGTGSANALLAGAAARQSAYGDVGEIWGRYFGGGK